MLTVGWGKVTNPNDAVHLVGVPNVTPTYKRFFSVSLKSTYFWFLWFPWTKFV
jgi:hypothetical protein